MKTAIVQSLELRKTAAIGAFLLAGGSAWMQTGIPSPALDLFRAEGEESFPSLVGSFASSETDTIEAVLRVRYRGPKSENLAELAKLIAHEARAHGFTSMMILSLIESESGFRPGVTSNRAALGLMQVQFPTAREVARKHGLHGFHSRSQLLDPRWNIRIGVRYLAELKKRFGGVEHALGAYNLGPAKYRKNLNQMRPQPKEVRKYIDGILNRQAHYATGHAFTVASN